LNKPQYLLNTLLAINELGGGAPDNSDLLRLLQLAAMPPEEAEGKSQIRAHYDALKQLGCLHGNINIALSLHKKRHALKDSLPRAPSLTERLVLLRRTVPLGDWQKQVAYAAARKLRPQIKNRNTPKASILPNNSRLIQVEDINEGRYSSNCQYTHWTYDILMDSWGMITHSGLRYHYLGKTYLFSHPKGYRWVGKTKIELTNGVRWYSPHGADLLSSDLCPRPLRELTAKVREQLRKQGVV